MSGSGVVDVVDNVGDRDGTPVWRLTLRDGPGDEAARRGRRALCEDRLRARSGRPVVGIDFPNEDKSKSNRRMEMLLCPPGEPVDLVLEPKNPHDVNAISVWSARGIQLGYITAERAPWIGSRIRAGEEYGFSGITG